MSSVRCVSRERAGIAPVAETVDTQEEVLLANLAERRREFALEGFRFFDLRRFRDIPAVNTALFGTQAAPTSGIFRFGETFRLLFPIPQSELDSNNLLVQNTGY